jgi:hypothetical protein
MKHLLFAIILFISGEYIAQVGQVGFEIIEGELTASEVKVIESKDWDSYRIISSRRVINFEGGIVIELFSVKELQKEGVEVDESKALADDYKLKNKNVFGIHSSGVIIETYQVENKKVGLR